MNPIDKALFHILQRCGLIAILRGVQPHEVVAIGHALYDAGFRIVEVPLNSPEPLASIRALRDALPADCLVGAGTVLSIEAVADVAAAGGQIIVMPHSDPDVIRAARAGGGRQHAQALPGRSAAAPCAQGLARRHHAAHGAGARGRHRAGEHRPYAAAGASGFGLGSALYRPGDQAPEVAHKAAAFARAWQASFGTSPATA